MDPSNPSAAMAAAGMGTLVVFLLIFVFMLVVWFNIFKKSGHSGWLSLLLIVPLANLILIIWFAFSEWPIQKKLKELGGGPS